MFRDQFRARLPIRYRNRRNSDGSTPPTSPTRMTSLEQSTLPTQSSDAIPPNLPQITSSTTSQHEVDATIEFTGESSSQALGEVKSTMPYVEMGEEDSIAIERLFGDDDSEDSLIDSTTTEESSSGLENIDQPIPNITLGPGETAFWHDGILKVKKTYEKDCEIIYTYGEKLAPKVPVFEIKMNDVISMNIPFKEDVSIRCVFSTNDRTSIISFFNFRATAIEPIWSRRSQDQKKYGWHPAL